MTKRPIGWMAATCAAWILTFPAVASTDNGGPTTLQLRLIGTIKSANGGIALCLDPATGQSFSLKIGEKFAGWELRSIHDGDAIFENASGRVVIRISSPANGMPFTPPPSVPVVPTPGATQPTPGAITPTKGTWVDGDGQMISPPRK
jgi:hypothetical protein